MLIIRPATREDIEAFVNLPNTPTMRAWVADLDGRIVGLGGIALSKGRWFAFVDLKDEARPFKVTIARSARRFLDEARRIGPRHIYAQVSKTEPRALPWLFSLGFDFDQKTQSYRWSAKA